MRMQEIRRAVDLLFGRNRFDFVDIQPNGDVRAYSRDGTEIILTIRSATFPESQEVDEAHIDLFRTRLHWSQESLRLRRLPPEWNREWLLTQVAQELLRAAGKAGVQATPGNKKIAAALRVVAANAARPIERLAEMMEEHGIHNPTREYIQGLWSSGNFSTQRQLAEHLGVSRAAVSRIVGSATQNSKRVDQNAALREVVLGVIESGLPPGTRQFTQEVVRRARERGETRSPQKILYYTRRIRGESGA